MWISTHHNPRYQAAEIVDELSRAVATKSVAEIDKRLNARVGRMSIAEARGYVRARARRVVRREVGLMIAERGAPAAVLQQTILTSALERAVHLVVRDLLKNAPTQSKFRMAA